MFSHILVPTDFSRASEHALKIAVDILLSNKGIVYLLHVIHIIEDTTFEEFSEFYSELERRAWSAMNGMVVPYEDGSVKMIPKIVYGKRTGKILAFASQHDIDLIVMHSHRIHPEDPVQGWGTISYKVGVLSQCPVMLIK